MPASRSLRQGFTALLLILLGLFDAHNLIKKILTGAHGDFFWSWKVGRWEVTHHAVFLHDPASWNGLALAKPWVNLEWGWQALLGVLGPHLYHAPALLLLLIVTWAGAWLSTLYLITLIQPNPASRLWLFVLMGTLGLMTVGFWTLRPQILSAIFWPWLLIILWKGRTDSRWLWWLLPLTVLWSNMHGDYLLVFFLLGIDGIFALYRKNWSMLQKILLVFILTLGLVIVATPDHWNTISYAVNLSNSHWIHQNISEWFSPTFSQPFWLIVLILWVFVLIASWRTPLDSRLIIWWGGTVVATLMYQRFFLYNLPLTILLLYQGLPAPSSHIKPRLIWFGIGFVSLIAIQWVPWSQYLWSSHVPRSVIAWTKTHPTPGIIFVPYDKGGEWERFNIPRVYIDGRAEFYLKYSQRFQTYVHWDNGTVPVSTLVHQGVTEIVWPTNASSIQTIRLHQADWHAIYHADHLTVWIPPSRKDQHRAHVEKTRTP